MKEDEMSEKCVHDWYYRIVDICSWQFFCIRCGEKLSLNSFADHASDLEKRMAELEAFIDQLIEAGDAMSNAQSMWVAEEDKWDALVKDWKEREE